MSFQLVLTEEADQQFEEVARRDVRKHRKVVTCLARIAENPRHPGLRTHKITGQKGPSGEAVWESYVENHTPGAWRVFWHYGPDGVSIRIITIVAITPHP